MENLNDCNELGATPKTNRDRFVLFSIENTTIWDFYKKAELSFWSEETLVVSAERNKARLTRQKFWSYLFSQFRDATIDEVRYNRHLELIRIKLENITKEVRSRFVIIVNLKLSILVPPSIRFILKVIQPTSFYIYPEEEISASTPWSTSWSLC